MPKAPSAKKPFDYGTPRFEDTDIDWLAARPWPKNAKSHDLSFLGEVFGENGFAEFPVFDEGTQKMVAGHGRVEKLVKMRDAGEPAPPRVKVKDGKWLVPTIRGMTFPKPGKHVLASNRGVEKGGWDTNLLAAALGSFGEDLVGTGYGSDDFTKLLAQMETPGNGGKTDPNDVPDAPKNPISKLGDLWILGDHKILCGDSTKEKDVALLMGGERAILMATDPPYGVDYTDEVRVGAERAHGRPQRKQKWEVSIDNDEKTGADIQPFLEAVFRVATAAALQPKAAWYLWHAQMTQGFFAAAAAAANLVLHRQIIWVKPALLFGFGDYHWRHELCFYGWVKGHRPPFYGKRNQTTVWEFGNETSNSKRVHPNQKPVAIFEIPMRNHVKAGGICYEPFSGSGTQIIAGQAMGKRVRAMEVDPRYVDVAVQRWEEFTGQKAKRAPGSGHPRSRQRPAPVLPPGDASPVPPVPMA